MRWMPAALPLFLASSAAPAAPAGDAALDLAGAWAFQLDPEDQGVAQQWFAKPLAHRLRLPGSLQAQGVGTDPDIATQWTGSIVDRSWVIDPRYAPYRESANFKIPCWLQPAKHYIGAAWYQREVEIPSAWRGKRIVLTLERPHWETRVWVGDKACGTNASLSTPHLYDLSESLTPGRHRLTLRVDNKMIVDVGVNAHSVTDHTQSNWNGIVGRLALLFEAKALGGKLMVCSMDLEDLKDRVVARQLRRSVLAYMAGDRFEPAVDLTLDQLHTIFEPATPVDSR
jgi:hypothetical protein